MKEKEVAPVMALNPYTGKLMNIEPVFEFIGSNYDIDGCYKHVDDVIKFLALSQLPEWADLDEKGNAIMFMYDLRDVFERLKECEISIPKKKGKEL